jgi:WD40 repeat protein
LWSKNGDLIHVFPGQKQFDPTSVAISSDGRYIFGAKGNSYTVHLWDQQNNFNEEVFRSDNIYISSIAVSSNGKTIAIVLGDIKLWERNEYSTSMLFENDGISIRKIAIAPDKEVIVSGGEDGSIGLWNFQGKPLYSFKGHEERINAVAVSSDGKIIITGGDDGIVKFWDKNGFSLIQPIPIERLRDDYGSYISSIALSSNGKLIIVGTEDGAIWRINRNGKIMGQPLIEEKGFVTSIAVDPENKIIAIASSSRNTIRLADFAGNFLDKSFMGHTQGVSSTAFSPDGKHIVSGSHDNTLRLWDINGFQIGTAFFGHEDSVTSVAFSPDGQYIVSGSLDQTVRIWNLQGNPIGKPLVDHKEGIGSVIISPNGKYIFSSSSGQVRRWEVGSWSNWLEVACNRLQYHPVLKNPQTEEQRGARATCQQYVWHGK